ncbi:MAG: cysteine-rich CWC family protein [Burkholderiaceae bacterium]
MKTVDPACCPLCGAPNACQMASPPTDTDTPGPCWCVTATFPPELLAKVPPDAANRACICYQCVSAFNARDPSDTVTK